MNFCVDFSYLIYERPNPRGSLNMINVTMQPTEMQRLSPKIAVIGVGGAGGNAVNNMISASLEGCEFLVCNTDSQALASAQCENKVQLGATVTGGLGAGSKPEIGKAAAEETLEEVMMYLEGANMAFVTAGMGGGTGTGAAPVIAKACRDQGILTVGVVTKPFHFEGVHRMEQAEKGIQEMQQYVDTLIVIPNQNLFRIANEKTTFAEAFKMADTVLQSGVRGVTDLMVRPGLVNLDFADIRTAMLQMGKAMMGTGEASGEKRAIEAAESAINNPLLDDVSMKGANGVIINVTGGYDMTLFEADEACNRIRDEVDPSANIIFGATFDESMDGFMRVSIVATGIEKEPVAKTKPFGGSAHGGPTDGGGPNGGQRQPLSSAGTAAMSAVSKIVQAAAPVQQEAIAASATPAEPVEAERPSPMVYGRDMIKGLTAPSPIAKKEVPEAQVAPKEVSPEPSSIDMFEQAEFSADVAETAVEETVLRGTTINNAFIPPQPIDAGIKSPVEGVGAHISDFGAGHVPEEVVKPSSLKLNPPKMTATPAAEQKSRTPSLFERITGSVQQHIDNLRDDGDLIKAAPEVDAPSQKSLDMSRPAGKPAVKIDDELDIPTFLRRQAN